MTPTVIYSAVAFVWIFGNLFELLAWYESMELNKTNFTCVENQEFFDGPRQTAIRGISIIVELIIPMTSLVVSYGIILRKIRKQRRVMDRKNTRSAAQQGKKSQ